MNQIPHRDRSDDEVDRIRAIVARHALPEFVTGFDVRLGDIEGDPTVWISFRTRGDLPLDHSDADRLLSEIEALQSSVRNDVIDSGEERFPYFRLTAPAQADAGTW